MSTKWAKVYKKKIQKPIREDRLENLDYFYNNHDKEDVKAFGVGVDEDKQSIEQKKAVIE